LALLKRDKSGPTSAMTFRAVVTSMPSMPVRSTPQQRNRDRRRSLCPGTKISGGKVLSSASKRTANRAAQALRLAATALRSSRSALGAYYRRLCARLDRAKAITAAAHKLARLIYTMLTKGSAYVDRGQDYYEERYRQRVLHHLTRRAQKLGFHLTPIQQAA
jgi:transposase